MVAGAFSRGHRARPSRQKAARYALAAVLAVPLLIIVMQTVIYRGANFTSATFDVPDAGRYAFHRKKSPVEPADKDARKGPLLLGQGDPHRAQPHVAQSAPRSGVENRLGRKVEHEHHLNAYERSSLLEQEEGAGGGLLHKIMNGIMDRGGSKEVKQRAEVHWRQQGAGGEVLDMSRPCSRAHLASSHTFDCGWHTTAGAYRKNWGTFFDWYSNMCFGPKDAKIYLLSYSHGYDTTTHHSMLLNRVHYMVRHAHDGAQAVKVCIFQQPIDATRPESWNKLAWEIVVANAVPDLKWLMVIDTDAIIVNIDKKVEDLLAKELKRHVKPQARRAKEKFPDAGYTEDPEIFYTHDYFERPRKEPLEYDTINEGVHVLRPTDFVLDYLTHVYNFYPDSVYHPWWQQHATLTFRDDFRKTFRRHFAVVPPDTLNHFGSDFLQSPEWHDIVNSGHKVPWHRNWPFIVHFAGAARDIKSDSVVWLTFKLGTWSRAPKCMHSPDWLHTCTPCETLRGLDVEMEVFGVSTSTALRKSYDAAVERLKKQVQERDNVVQKLLMQKMHAAQERSAGRTAPPQGLLSRAWSWVGGQKPAPRGAWTSGDGKQPFWSFNPKYFDRFGQKKDSAPELEGMTELSYYWGDASRPEDSGPYVEVCWHDRKADAFDAKLTGLAALNGTEGLRARVAELQRAEERLPGPSRLNPHVAWREKAMGPQERPGARGRGREDGWAATGRGESLEDAEGSVVATRAAAEEERVAGGAGPPGEVAGEERGALAGGDEGETRRGITRLGGGRSERHGGILSTTQVLLVEDDPLTLRVLQATLARAQYEVIVAMNGNEAMRALHEHGDSVDLILTDVLMPEANGFDLLISVLQEPRYAPIPVVLMSSSEDQELRDRGLLAGARGFLSKPVCRDDIDNIWPSVLGPDQDRSTEASGEDGTAVNAPSPPASAALPLFQTAAATTSPAPAAATPPPQPRSQGDGDESLPSALLELSLRNSTARQHQHTPPPPSAAPAPHQPPPLPPQQPPHAKPDAPPSGRTTGPTTRLSNGIAAGAGRRSESAVRGPATASDPFGWNAAQSPALAQQQQPGAPHVDPGALYAAFHDALRNGGVVALPMAASSQRTAGQNSAAAAHRAAALARFREKRRNRQFGKVVRYESRRKLAEQRPRIRGQFVKMEVAQAMKGEEKKESEGHAPGLMAGGGANKPQGRRSMGAGRRSATGRRSTEVASALLSGLDGLAEIAGMEAESNAAAPGRAGRRSHSRAR
ncbi:unnamed protein product [Pedinophyceae sp. YPF-701]|nr:unnamed protein product [Pedinophyceae sp. YPF-701]